jgi:hypothetical protein
MIPEILADAGKVVPRRNADVLQQAPVADP